MMHGVRHSQEKVHVSGAIGKMLDNFRRNDGTLCI